MRTNLSPWFRDAMSADEKAAVRQADPRDATVTGLASSPKGPFTASIIRHRQSIGSGIASTPAAAIAIAVERSLERVA